MTTHEGFTPDYALDIITADASIGALPLDYDLNALRKGIANIRAENQRLREALEEIMRAVDAGEARIPPSIGIRASVALNGEDK